MTPALDEFAQRPAQPAEAPNGARGQCREAKRRGCAAPAFEDDVRKHVIDQG